jgi:hypothetical protein
MKMGMALAIEYDQALSLCACALPRDTARWLQLNNLRLEATYEEHGYASSF